MYNILIVILLIIGFFFLNNNTQNNYLNSILKTLMRQSARWSSAALQDESPLVAVLHANYGASYIWAVKDIATSEQVKKATGIDMIKFQKKITEVQDKATKRMVKLCPEYAGQQDQYLAAIAGEG